MTLLIFICCLLLGSWLCYQSYLSYQHVRDMKAHGLQTEACIVDVIEEESYDPESGTSTSYWPIYEYTDIHGKVHQQKPTSTTGLVKYKKGDNVSIIYDPNDPDTEILVLTKAGKWTEILGFLIGGLFVIFSALAGYCQ